MAKSQSSKPYRDAIHDAKMKELCLDCKRPYGEHHLTLRCPVWTKEGNTERCYTFKETKFVPSGEYEK